MITSINEYQTRVTFFIVGELGMTAYYHISSLQTVTGRATTTETQRRRNYPLQSAVGIVMGSSSQKLGNSVA